MSPLDILYWSLATACGGFILAVAVDHVRSIVISWFTPEPDPEPEEEAEEPGTVRIEVGAYPGTVEMRVVSNVDDTVCRRHWMAPGYARDLASDLLRYADFAEKKDAKQTS